jgi:hypothetical protein
MVGKLSIEKWGPCGWNFLHAVSFTYPKVPTLEQKKTMYAFLHTVGRVLPCPVCNTHFTQMIERELAAEELSTQLTSRDALSRFLVAAHNEVNVRLNKRQLTYDEVVQQYMYSERKVSWIVIVVLGILFLIVLRVLMSGVRRKPPKTLVARQLTSFYS